MRIGAALADELLGIHGRRPSTARDTGHRSEAERPTHPVRRPADRRNENRTVHCARRRRCKCQLPPMTSRELRAHGRAGTALALLYVFLWASAFVPSRVVSRMGQPLWS